MPAKFDFSKFMKHDIQPRRDHEQALIDLDNRERKTREKWVAFKKALRADHNLEPDSAALKFCAEEAKYEAAMKWIDQQRAHVTRSH